MHIVSFDIPYPPDYGGVTDVLYKIKALREAGSKIHLHCFEYGRKPAAELHRYCESVHYYPRKTGLLSWLSSVPYITRSRRSEILLERLAKDKHPILFEGIHCCYYLDNKKLRHKTRIVRSHNIEHDYYRHLSKAEKNPFKKLFFITEALKLKRYEKTLMSANGVAAISPADQIHFAQYGHSELIPAFHPEYRAKAHSGFGEGIVYHGNLSVGENIKAALYLIREVFSKIDKTCVIAGRNPAPEILKAAKPYSHIRVIANPPDSELENLIREAQINVLITFQSTGIKLKLLNALSLGRHCMVNTTMVANTGLEDLCHIADKPEAMVDALDKLYSEEYNACGQAQKERQKLLGEKFSNAKSARRLLNLAALFTK